MTVRNVDVFFRSRRIGVIGAASGPVQQQMLANLQRSVPALACARSVTLLLREHREGCELIVIFDPRGLTPTDLRDAAAAGCRGLVWANVLPVPTVLLETARESWMRILGPRAAGAANPAAADVSGFVQFARPGHVALIAQSASVAAAAMDWAAGRKIGFSWCAATGAEADVDIGDLLDYAALDPGTQAVVLQLGRIRGARKFMSAARACSRAKPVVVLQSHLGDDASAADSNHVRSVAFERAGLVECTTLDGMFDAIAALHQVPNRRQMRVLVIGNGGGVCALGIDALRRWGLAVAELSPETLLLVMQLAPQTRPQPGGLDVGPLPPPAWVAVIRHCLDDPATDVVLSVQSPYAGQAHDPFAEALVDAGFGPRVVTVWLGLQSAMGARARCAEAGVATFVSAGQAARALHYRAQHRRTQELLMQTPRELALRAVQRARADEIVAQHVQPGREVSLRGEAVEQLLACYGLRGRLQHVPLRLHIKARRHPEAGLYFAMRAEAAGLYTAERLAFPPVDEVLLTRALEPLGLPLERREFDRVLGGLLRLSQCVIDQRPIVGLKVSLALAADGKVALLPGAELQLDPEPALRRTRLALAPYPTHLSHEVRLHERKLRVRAIRPEDEAGVLELLQSLDPEDIRLRFFHYIRFFTHEMAARMTQIDYDRELGLVAMPQRQPRRVVGLAHLISDPDGARAEYALVVHREYAGRGLGRHLMNRLLDYARARGIGCVYGEVLVENRAMLHIARSLGFSQRPDPDDPRCMLVQIELSPTA